MALSSSQHQPEKHKLAEPLVRDAAARRTSSTYAACANGATSYSQLHTGGGRARLEATTACPRPTSRCTWPCCRACWATSAARREDRGCYLGARGIKFYRPPGRANCSKKAGDAGSLAAELVETDAPVRPRHRPHRAAWLDPEWAPTCSRSQLLDPHWEKKAMQVAGWERATLYGLVVYTKRRVNLRPGRPRPRRARSSSARAWSARNRREAKRCRSWRPTSKLIRDIEKIEHKRAGRTCWWTTS